jgi:hypothetical protein
MKEQLILFSNVLIRNGEPSNYTNKMFSFYHNLHFCFCDLRPKQIMKINGKCFTTRLSRNMDSGTETNHDKFHFDYPLLEFNLRAGIS